LGDHRPSLWCALKHFQKKFTMHEKGQKVNYDDVKVIPLNGELFLQFQIGNTKFLDSFQFLSTSLENLVTFLLKSGKENFHHTIKHQGDTEFTFAKGVFPYMTDRSKFDETRLPPIDAFYNTLNDEPLSDEDYDRAHKFGISTASKIYNISRPLPAFRRSVAGRRIRTFPMRRPPETQSRLSILPYPPLLRLVHGNETHPS